MHRLAWKEINKRGSKQTEKKEIRKQHTPGKKMWCGGKWGGEETMSKLMKIPKYADSDLALAYSRLAQS